jgi:hypothetical protein
VYNGVKFATANVRVSGSLGFFTMSSSTASPARASAGPSESHVDRDVALDSVETVARKVVRKQKLEGKEYTASEIAELLCGRKNKGQARYWDKLAVDVVSVEENLAGETLRYDKVVVRCILCHSKHDSKSLNVANFASSHFSDRQGACICKNIAKKGETALLRTLFAVTSR